MSNRPARMDPMLAASFAYFAFWGWFNYSFGPVIPLIREELGTSRTVAGLHATALAAGAIVAGAVVRLAVPHVGRVVCLLGGGAVALGGLVLILVSDSAALSLPGAMVTGVGGSVAVNVLNAAISDHSGERSPVIMSRVNAVSSLCGIIAPLALGASLALGLGWRPALALTLPLGLLALFLVRAARGTPALATRRVVAENTATRQDSPRSTPVARRFFWAVWAAMTLNVGVEVSITYWGIDFMQTAVGLDADIASLALSALLLGMMLGRVFGTPFIQGLGEVGVVLASIAISVLGWFVLWSANSMPWAAGGLLVLGCGLALQFPVLMARFFRAAQGRSDSATALVSVALGSATGVVPIFNGWLADATDVETAFLVVPVLLVLTAALVGLGPREPKP